MQKDLKVSGQCVKAVKTANRVLAMIKRIFTTRDKVTMPSLYKSLVRPYILRALCTSLEATLIKRY